jgi:hypothetical protein
MRRTGDVWLALVLSALATVACSDPHAGPLPTTSPSSPASTSTTSPTTSPSDPSAVLARAAQSYYRTLQGAASDPASKRAALARLIDTSCECRQVLALLDRLAQERHTLRFTVKLGTPRVAETGASRGTVFINVDQSAGKELDTSGAVVRTLPGSHGQYVLDFVRRDSRWLVKRITRS